VPALRQYDDPCGTARALDLIGERWALLVVRELLFGPKRFGALRTGLRGISPNVLSQRLRELESAGILRRDQLDPPANVAVYDLTERGLALEPILIELGRWGAREPVASANELTVDALALALKTTFRPAFDADLALGIDGEWFSFSARDGSCSIIRGRAPQATTTLSASSGVLRSYAFGRTTLEDAERAGLVVAGSRQIARRFPKLFHVPS
jgi:DNA-binding HxlR family transcriptional regulator